MTEVYHSIVDYLEAYNNWLYTPAVITPDGEMMMIVKGERIPKKEFDHHNPKPYYEPLSGVGLDGERESTLFGIRNPKKQSR